MIDDRKIDQIQIIEELSLNALPCLQQILYDGWILRFAQGYTKRANSVTPLYTSSLNSETKIQRCEDIYRSFALKPIFRLTNSPQLQALDETLDSLGYQKQDTVSVRVKAIEDRFSPNHLVTLNPEISQEWLDQYVHAVETPIQHWNTLSTMLEIIPNPTCYSLLHDRSRFCSCGLGVLENNYLGLFFVATAKRQQGKGYAGKLISAMLHWGKNHGATQAYIQVETKNQRAINLYNKLGFAEVYQYFYRIKSA